jgi:hypothetical protein
VPLRSGCRARSIAIEAAVARAVLGIFLSGRQHGVYSPSSSDSGEHHGLEVAFISETLGIANWIATLGAVLVIVDFHSLWDFQTDHRRHAVDARWHLCLQLLRGEVDLDCGEHMVQASRGTS